MTLAACLGCGQHFLAHLGAALVVLLPGCAPGWSACFTA
jgi:hypothetical protein